MSGEGLIAEARAVHQSVGHARLKELMHRGTEFLGCDVAIMGDTLNGPRVNQTFWGLTPIPTTGLAVGRAIVGD